MKNQELYDALLQELYISFKNYNKKPNYFTEDALAYNVDVFNRFARKNQLHQINWNRDNDINNYKIIRILYVPFNSSQE